MLCFIGLLPEFVFLKAYVFQFGNLKKISPGFFTPLVKHPTAIQLKGFFVCLLFALHMVVSLPVQDWTQTLDSGNTFQNKGLYLK